jgi:hypothetical protein
VEQEEEEIIENAPEEPVLEVPAIEKGEGSKENDKKEEKPPPPTFDMVPAISNVSDEPVITRLTFDDIDHVLDESGKEEKIEAPKSLDRLEEISVSRNLQRKLEEEASDDEEKLTILGDDVNVDLGIMSFDAPFDNAKKTAEDIIQLDFDTF